MGKWEMVRLGDVATYVNGFAFKPSDWGKAGLPIIRIQNLTGNDYETNYYDGKYDKKYEVNKGDILISWSASLGVFEWKRSTALLNQHIFKVVFDKLDININYFVFVVSNAVNGMLKYTHGSTMKHIIKSDFDNIQIPLPPLDIQQKIADTLDKASALIELRKAQLDKLDLLIKSQFIEMFGDPVINPKGWEQIRLSECLHSIESGISPKCESHPAIGDEYGVLKLSAVTSGTYRESENKLLPPNINFKENLRIKKGDLLMTRKNTYDLVGMSAYVFDTTAYLMMPDLIFRLNTIDTINKLYLWKLLNNTSFREQVKALAGGTAGSMPNISKERLKELTIPLPPTSFQIEFAAFVERVENQKKTLQQSLSKLELNYKSLMQKCFRGDLF